MDVLVVVGSEPAPARLTDRALHVHRFQADEPLATLIGALRARIPRRVGVWGPVDEAATVAVGLRRAGLPTELFTDDAIIGDNAEALTGVDIRRVTDPGPAMDVADVARRPDRPHPDGPPRPHRPGPRVHTRRQARDVQPRRVVQGPARADDDPSGRADGRLLAGRHDRGAHERQHRRGPGDRGGPSGLPLHVRLPRQGGPDKIALLRAYGAEVIVCPTSVAPEHPESYYSVSDRLAREIPGAWKPDQYHNPNNPEAQYETAGPEIWEQTKGRVTHFVAGVGTGGTDHRHRPVPQGAEPSDPGDRRRPRGFGVLGGSGRPYLVEGIGEDFWPTTYDPSVVDRVVPSPTPRASPPPGG